MNIADCHILVADDHSLMRKMVTTELQKLGAQNLTEAADGAIAIEKIKEATENGNIFNVIFLDWTMPNTNGFEVLTFCRADERMNDTAIVMLSSESEETNIIKALEAGATAYVTKPFKPETLRQKVEDVLKWKFENNGELHG